MKEVTNPIIAIALVLVAVFVPLAFISGLSGQFYKQFAMTIAISTVISAINSLTLSPALAALLLKPHEGKKTNWFFRGFNRYFGTASERLQPRRGRACFRARALMIGVYVALLAVTGVLFRAVPERLRAAAGQAVPDRLRPAARRRHARPHRGRDAPHGRDHDEAARRGERGRLPRPVDQRLHQQLERRASCSPRCKIVRRSARARHFSGGAIAGALNQQFAGIQDAFIVIFPPPPVQGLGTTGGFKLYLEDRASLGYEALDQATKAFMAKAYQAPELAGMFTTYQVNVPQLYADIDRTKARQLGVPVTEVFDTMQIYLGSLYVNDFNKFGRTYSVRVQADAPYRARAEDVGLLKVRSNTGEMVPLSALMNVRNAAGPERAIRYNGFLAADISGRAAPGYSSGQAQDAIERIAAETLPPGIGYEWTEITYQEILSGNSAIWVYPLAIFLVFLVLAALYESLALPIAIILIVPLEPRRRAHRRLAHQRRQQHLHPDRLHGAGGPRGEERDPDRRVRARAGVRRPHAGAGRDRGEPAAAAADHHDLDRLHHGRGAARLLGRRRRRDAPGDGHRGVRRHDRRHRLRHLPHPGVLRAAARADRQPAAQAPRRGPCAGSGGGSR